MNCQKCLVPDDIYYKCENELAFILESVYLIGWCSLFACSFNIWGLVSALRDYVICFISLNFQSPDVEHSNLNVSRSCSFKVPGKLLWAVQVLRSAESQQTTAATHSGDSIPSPQLTFPRQRSPLLIAVMLVIHTCLPETLTNWFAAGHELLSVNAMLVSLSSIVPGKTANLPISH